MNWSCLSFLKRKEGHCLSQQFPNSSGIWELKVNCCRGGTKGAMWSPVLLLPGLMGAFFPITLSPSSCVILGIMLLPLSLPCQRQDFSGWGVAMPLFENFRLMWWLKFQKPLTYLGSQGSKTCQWESESSSHQWAWHLHIPNALYLCSHLDQLSILKVASNGSNSFPSLGTRDFFPSEILCT